MTKIHPTAIVDKTAEIDPSVTVGPYAIIGAGVFINKNTTVGHHAWIESARIGSDNSIYPYAVIGAAPQDLKHDGTKTEVQIGNGCVVREFATIHRATNPAAPTRIGDNCFLMSVTHVGHDCRVGNNVIIANGTQIAGHVEIADGVVMSALVGIHQFVRIGRLVMIGGGAMVSQDIPPFVQAQGDRAQLVGLNVVGLKRNRIKPESISEIKSAFRNIFISGIPMQEALDQIAAAEPVSEVRELIEFIQKSKRGVCRARFKEALSEDE
ncbi:MAG: acyl-[acyl-carrier-protein]--UDP-N-acetylglucosamine O-acyltransferase [Elusimicrobia bacterium HGW-Elusimicrobia-1]|jgi:UDP-N-acetylglucosamine acyltransferase|nr:MAG: acyl-[acyl-carrier-protein]--UDP-N-acetylglucosamine O-acyltransferase [Elusimicrobia bacterium HGW-Elusimicrobia-1]